MAWLGWLPRLLVLWVAIGQSNMLGRGNAALAPLVLPGHGLEFIYDGNAAKRRTQHLREPVGITTDPDGTGSMHSAFCNRFAELTGHQAVILSTAVGGTAQTIEAGQAAGRAWWEPGGARYAATVTSVNNVKAWLDASGDPWVFGGVLHDQGGQDAIQMDAGTPGLNKARYKNGFELMAAGFRTDFGVPNLPIIVSRLGRPTSGDTPGWADVRTGQDELVAADPHTYFGFTRAIEFPADVPPKQWDEYHYDQFGQNEAGTAMATVAAGLV